MSIVKNSLEQLHPESDCNSCGLARVEYEARGCNQPLDVCCPHALHDRMQKQKVHERMQIDEVAISEYDTASPKSADLTEAALEQVIDQIMNFKIDQDPVQGVGVPEMLTRLTPPASDTMQNAFIEERRGYMAWKMQQVHPSVLLLRKITDVLERWELKLQDHATSPAQSPLSLNNLQGDIHALISEMTEHTLMFDKEPK